MTTLATLTQAIENLCYEIEDVGDGAIPDDLLERFTSAQMAHADKVSAYVGAVKSLQYNAAYYSDRAELLKRRAKTCERIEKEIKERLVYQIQTHPDLPFKSAEGDKIALRKSHESLVCDIKTYSRSFSNVLDNIVELSYDDVLQFTDVVQVLCLNKEKVKEHLKSGYELKWARLKDDNVHVRFT